MPKLPRIPSILVIRAIKRAGFFEFHQSGSHIQFRHQTNKLLKLTIPFKHRDLAPKTLKSIINQAGLTVDQFLDLL